MKAPRNRFWLIVTSLMVLTVQCRTGHKEQVEEKQNLIESDSSHSTLNTDSSMIKTMANILFQTNEYQKALEKYNRLIELDSLNGQFYFRKAYCLVQLNRHSESVKYYLKAADLGFERFESFRSLGITYSFVIKNDKQAVIYFKKCLEIDPNSEEVKKFLREIQKASDNKSL